MTRHLYACLVMQIKSHVIISYYQNCHCIVLLHMNILAKRISTNRNRKLDRKFHSNCKKKSINAHKPYCFSSKFPVFIRLLVGHVGYTRSATCQCQIIVNYLLYNEEKTYESQTHFTVLFDSSNLSGL